MNPFARNGRASGRRALQTHPAACPSPIENEDLPSGDFLVTTGAPALVVERTPETEFVEISKNIELVLGRESQGRRMEHPGIMEVPGPRTIGYDAGVNLSRILMVQRR